MSQAQFPVSDLPTLFTMPEAVVYPATADRISRLRYGELFVTFHARIGEIKSMARILAATLPPVARRGTQAAELSLMCTPKNVALLGAALLDTCEVARVILLRH